MGSRADAADRSSAFRIESLTLEDLRDSLARGTLWTDRIHPITRHRAAAQLRNPRAKSTDVVLLLARQGDEIISYLGILPDHLFAGDRCYHIGWLSTWWTDPTRPKNTTALMLLFKAIGAYPDGIGVRGFTASAQAIYEGVRRFAVVEDAHGLLGILRLRGLAKALGQRVPRLQRAMPLAAALAAPIDALLRLGQSAWGRAKFRNHDLSFEYLQAIDAEADALIAACGADDPMRRSKAELVWMLQHPWVLNAPLRDRNQPAFFFTSTSARFFYLCIKVYESSELAALVILRMNDGEMAVPYYWCHAGRERVVMQAVALHLLAMDVDRLRIYRKGLVAAFRPSGFPFILRARVSRKTLLTRNLSGVADARLEFQDGDGDMAFT